MKYTLTFTQEELQIINDGLIGLPYIKVALLINIINKQINEQSKEVSDE